MMSQLDCNQPFVHEVIKTSNLHNFLCEYAMDNGSFTRMFLVVPSFTQNPFVSWVNLLFKHRPYGPNCPRMD